MHYSYAVPYEAVNYYAESFVNNPVGSGPYILDKWKKEILELNLFEIQNETRH